MLPLGPAALAALRAISAAKAARTTGGIVGAGSRAVDPAFKNMTNTIIRAKGIDISIGNEIHKVALFSQNTGNAVTFKSIKKGGRLAKIKRKFKNKLVSNEDFFFERMYAGDIMELIKMLK